jgi:hypothetical protein
MLSHMKRTTLVIESALYADLKRRAAAEGRTLTDTIERALRRGLLAPAASRRGRLTLPSYDLGPYLSNPADRATFGAPPHPGEEPE